jgi:hypothetical protein
VSSHPTWCKQNGTAISASFSRLAWLFLLFSASQSSSLPPSKPGWGFRFPARSARWPLLAREMFSHATLILRMMAFTRVLKPLAPLPPLRVRAAPLLRGERREALVIAKECKGGEHHKGSSKRDHGPPSRRQEGGTGVGDNPEPGRRAEGP